MTRSDRTRIVAIVAAGSRYAADTVRISRDGEVSALHDADKVLGCDKVRRLVGLAPEMLSSPSAF